MEILLTVLFIILSILALSVLIVFFALFSKTVAILTTEGKTVNLKVKAMGISFNIPLEKNNKKKKEKPEKKAENEETVMKKLLDLRNNFNRQKNSISFILKYLRKKLEIEKIGVTGEFGTGNAATTGMAYGVLSGFVNTVFGFLGKYFIIKNPLDEAIRLDYNKAVFNLKFAFIIKTKLWYLLKALLIYKNNSEKIKRGDIK